MAQDSLRFLIDDPSLLVRVPAKLREEVVGYLAAWEGPEIALSLLELLPASTQLSLRDRRVNLLCAAGRADEAVVWARERIALRPSASASCLLARALHSAGDSSSALALLDELMKDRPDLATVWSTRGEILLATGDRAGAEDCFQQVLALRPDSSTGRRGLARCAGAAGDLAAARDYYDQALATAGVLGPSLMREALALYDRLGDQARAGRLRDELEERKRASLENLIGHLNAKAGAKLVASTPSARPTGGKTLLDTERTADGWSALADSRHLASIAGPSSIEEAVGPPEVQRLLRTVFGHPAFRPGQVAVVRNVLHGLDTLAVMPTGSGKSLCYQLPSLLLPCPTLVISPLIALMKDQVDSLPLAMRSKTTLVNSTLDRGELDRRLAEIVGGRYRLIYAAPERLRQRPFLHALRTAGLSLLVIDEAHCVSMWGHDFRPDYLFIAKAIAELGNPTLLAMTATATPEMAQEIALQFARPLYLVRTSMHRPNLRLEVQACQNAEEKMRAMVEICRKETGAGIVYVNSREKAEELSELLRRKARVDAQHYHAGMEKDEREAAQDRFMSGRTRIMVATVAFGMGVDKEDVRFIVHYDLPRSLEGYSQEIGRAGRDDRPARCVLLYTSAAKGLLTRHANEDRLSLDELRAVYKTLRDQAVAGHGLIASSDLERALVDAGGERNLESHSRVAVSLLEKAGLVIRHFDLPRTSVVTLYDGSAGEADGEFGRFVKVMRLPVGRPLDLDFLQAARDSHISPAEIESRLLQWQEQGWLAYHGVGRDLHVELLDAPADSRQRLEGLLDRQAQMQEEQIEEIASYATTAGCRQGVLVAHFGERLRSKCSSCDYCSPGRSPATSGRRAPAPSAGGGEPRPIVVACLQSLPNAVGRTGLIRTLRGSIAGPFGAERSPQFGALAGLSKGKLESLIQSLIDDGTLEPYERDGYPLLRVASPPQSPLRLQVT